LINVVAWLTLFVMMVLYVNHERREDDRRWCELLVTLTTNSPPPAPGRGQIIANILENMKRDFNC